jgi:hypothetical protein
MNRLAILLIAIGAVLSGCVAYPAGYREGGYRDSGAYSRDADHDGIPNRVDRDRDGDGVPNNRDVRPNNPRQY